jgi:L-ascorbate metabolism protein UlaG (beta-lactamase superfamily)
MSGVSLTWLGHAAFRVDTPSGKRIYIDPWLGNPKCPEAEQEPERVDLIVLTHGHDDHVGAAVELANKFSAPVYAMVELRSWLSTKGLSEDATQAINKGGTAHFDGVSITLTDAKHSSSGWEDGKPVYLGEAAGVVLGIEDAATIYFAGDTCVFGDMALIGRIYKPDLAVLPIGDHYTMGPKEAAVAAELLGVKRMVPCHWGTFGLLTGTPDACRELMSDCEVVALEPGQTVEV